MFEIESHSTTGSCLYIYITLNPICFPDQAVVGIVLIVCLLDIFVFEKAMEIFKYWPPPGLCFVGRFQVKVEVLKNTYVLT